MGVGVGVGMGVGVGWAEVAAAAAVVVRPEEVPVIEAVQATLAVEVTAICTHLPHRQSPCGDVSRVRRPRERLCRRATQGTARATTSPRTRTGTLGCTVMMPRRGGAHARPWARRRFPGPLLLP
jgi:hypothetical protein